jgi:exodeoxyribonuclease VII large subunit
VSTAEPQPAAAGIPGSVFPGPYPVGSYASQLRARLREFARVQLVGEVFGLRVSRVRVYFELRDARGALPCSIWRNDFEQLAIPVTDGMQVVVGGGCDYYPGSSSSSPSFSFDVTELRVAGEGDLLIQLQRLRRKLAADGLFEPQKRLPRPALPRTIGVVTGEDGKARHDVLAGLKRRGWAGRLVWAFAPVQDRHAAPRIAAALRELAAQPEVEVVIVARGGGSLADLFAFCDEALCRTVALLRVPVIASSDRRPARAIRSRMRASRTGSSRPRSTRASRSRSIRASRRASADRARADDPPAGARDTRGVRAQLRRRFARRPAGGRCGAEPMRGRERAVAPDRPCRRLADPGRPPAGAARRRGGAVPGRAGRDAGGAVAGVG